MEFPYDVRVDRTSKLGNKFYMANESERANVCLKYRGWLSEKLIDDSNIINEMNNLYKLYKLHGNLRLFCWCFPKQCHAEVIREFLEPFILS
jgi:hypothetical protein